MSLARLGERAGTLFPPSVAVGAALPCDPGALHPVERAGIRHAVPARQREFAGGRAAARIAQVRLGLPPHPVPMGPDRAPVWPAGLCGTITHGAGVCLAAVTADPGIAGLGLDLEPDEPLPEGVMGEVLSAGDDPRDARAVFCAKEAVFKALYPSVGFVFGFDAVRIAGGEGVFAAVLLHRLGRHAGGTRLEGRWLREDGVILAALTL